MKLMMILFLSDNDVESYIANIMSVMNVIQFLVQHLATISQHPKNKLEKVIVHRHCHNGKI